MRIALKYFLTTNTNLGKQKRAPSVSLSLPFYNIIKNNLSNYNNCLHHPNAMENNR